MTTLEGLKFNLVFEEQIFKGVYIINPVIFYDERGSFFESFKESKFEKILNCKFVQDNEVFSEKVNTLRGLHYQMENAQAKLIHVISGSIKDVIVDVRANSKTFGESFSVNLSHENHKMLFIPKGFAHGYLALKANTMSLRRIFLESIKSQGLGTTLKGLYCCKQY